jgi:hypothetical protein
MRERLPHGFRTDRQVTNASARGGKDRVRDRGRDGGRRRLAEANRRFRAREKFALEFGYVAHAQQRIGVQISILRLTFHELRSFMKGHAQSPQRATLSLGRGTVQMNDRAGVDEKCQLLDRDLAAGAVDPHASDAGDPGGHFAFLAECSSNAEPDILRGCDSPARPLGDAGEHCCLPSRTAYAVRR